MDKYTATGFAIALLDYLLEEYATSRKPEFTEQFLQILKPEIVVEMQKMAHGFLKPPVASLVLQYKLED